MEITIKINGRFVSVEVSAEVADYLEQAKRNNRKLYRERQRYWDGRECDEYIIATEGRLPYCATPEELVCHQEGLLSVPAGPETVRLLPPLNVSEEEIQQALAIIRRVLKTYAK